MGQNILFHLLISLFVPLVANVHWSAAAVSSSAIQSLAGVTAVRVVAEDLTAAMQKTGLRKEQLEGHATETLRKNGIDVVTAQEQKRVPIVYIRLSSVFAGEHDSAPISFYLTLQVKQPAVLTAVVSPVPTQAKAQVGLTPLLVTTWEHGTMAIVNPPELFFYVKHILINLIGDLVYDRQQANEVKESR